MKKKRIFRILFVLLLSASMLLVFVRVTNLPLPEFGDLINKITNSEVSQPGIPKILIIPKLSITSSVEEVGLTTNFDMDVPKDVNNVGWYMLGYKPGENGNAVFDGHLDSYTGPAIFYKLERLLPNDIITVIDQNGNSFVYKVSTIKSYPYHKFPLKEVFATKGQPQLVLITCDGQYDKNTNNYSDRTVVYSTLVNTIYFDD